MTQSGILSYLVAGATTIQSINTGSRLARRMQRRLSKSGMSYIIYRRCSNGYIGTIYKDV